MRDGMDATPWAAAVTRDEFDEIAHREVMSTIPFFMMSPVMSSCLGPLPLHLQAWSDLVRFGCPV
jgi:hypothetical protein